MWNDDLFSEASRYGKPRAHMVYAAVSLSIYAAKSGVGLFVLFPLQRSRNTILSDELQLKMQLLVRESLML